MGVQGRPDSWVAVAGNAIAKLGIRSGARVQIRAHVARSEVIEAFALAVDGCGAQPVQARSRFVKRAGGPRDGPPAPTGPKLAYKRAPYSSVAPHRSRALRRPRYHGALIGSGKRPAVSVSKRKAFGTGPSVPKTVGFGINAR